jgi:hypothetical protein
LKIIKDEFRLNGSAGFNLIDILQVPYKTITHALKGSNKLEGWASVAAHTGSFLPISGV